MADTNIKINDPIFNPSTTTVDVGVELPVILMPGGPVPPGPPPGFTGIQGPTGAPGPTGVQGAQGPMGLHGHMGPIGYTGVQGIQGIQGSQGPIGVTGLQGIAGEQGVTGVRGEQGITGIQGVQGLQGIAGNDGTQGVTGVQGIQGLQGKVGLHGHMGPVGPQGSIGLQGVQGIAGECAILGAQGAQGPKGAQGLQGISVQGVQGSQGIQGTQGILGLRGATGPQGDKGDKGEPAGLVFDKLEQAQDYVNKHKSDTDGKVYRGQLYVILNDDGNLAHIYSVGDNYVLGLISTEYNNVQIHEVTTAEKLNGYAIIKHKFTRSPLVLMKLAMTEDEIDDIPTEVLDNYYGGRDKAYKANLTKQVEILTEYYELEDTRYVRIQWVEDAFANQLSRSAYIVLF